MKERARAHEHIRRPLVPIVGAVALLAALAGPSTRIGHAAAGPTPGGSITVALGAAPDCLDPQRTAASASDAVIEEVVDGLLSLDDNYQVQPNLATKWTISPDGKTVTFQLRHNVRFSNGDPFTANDVKFSFDRAVDPATKSLNSGTLLAGVKQTVVVDPYTVQLILKAPSRALLSNLATGYAGILDQKALAAEGPDKFCQYPVGTGPFMVQSVGPGFSTVTLTRNPYRNWEPPQMHNQGPAYLQSVVFKTIVSTATQISELLTGQVDYTGIDATQLSRVQHNSKITIYEVPSTGEEMLEFNTAHAPFNSVSARLAVAEAISRDSLVKAAYGGQGQPAYSPIPANFAFYDPAAPTYAPKYNPSDAAKRFAAAGAKSLYTLLSFSDPISGTSAELIQAELGAAGLRVRITPKTIPDFISAADKGQFDLLILGWTYTPDPAIMFQFFHSSQEVAGGLNFTTVKSSVIDNALTAGATTFDSAKAQAAYNTFQRYVDQNVVADPLVTPEGIAGVTTRVKGVHVGGKVGAALFYQDLYVQ